MGVDCSNMNQHNPCCTHSEDRVGKQRELGFPRGITSASDAEEDMKLYNEYKANTQNVRQENGRAESEGSMITPRQKAGGGATHRSNVLHYSSEDEKNHLGDDSTHSDLQASSLSKFETIIRQTE